MKSKGSTIKLRYGENPSQKGYLINYQKNSVIDYQIGGKQISYNNLIDLDSGLKCLKEFNEPTSIILKHTNPCGVASAKKIEVAYNKSYESDPKSSFGGIVLLNRKVNSRLAKKINKNFFEMIVALDYELEALKILTNKKNLILLKIPNIKKPNLEYKSTLFGDLYQTTDLKPINKRFLSLISKKRGSSKSINDLIFSLKVAKHLKSNAIVLSRNKQTLGLGHGQTNRVDALNYAIKNMNKYFKKGAFVCASDGFFPFVDSINLLKRSGCNAVAQPSGSINDKIIISFSIKNKISLYFIKNRLFKH
tara:strand:- start:243 stop:1160 length:918 start_codon:yes stop_codon:yes gene_type:complete